ncbi:3' terminal RNA ribose 2'-O-methyltransferase Hen1 [Thermoflavimicrobium dichotomicum]|uniref:Small RNA 2'-O-methyltransferase n=1 Tax=Thermoflavimicrobium dichotomicum TaxID=46223 RepID=A0A1I3RR53_9BACL|nr:3' terminal RNA ribose 2'-O-methyltransferase Hen1 [Thermoflavimicrobium dichotomicum]
MYVLIPVLDDEKHYWVGEDELHKLFRHGEKWLPLHPERELIATRYLKYRKKLAYTAIQHLSEQHTSPIEEVQEEDEVEKPLRLHELRMQLVVDRLKESGAKSVLDLGCGEGKLLRLLMKEKEFTRLAGVDVSYSVLQMAQKRLNLAQTERVELWHGSLLYRDQRWKGFDAATLIEVIEHIEPDRLPSFEQALFGYAKPRTVILTTPNAEYNVRFAGLSPGKFRHPDHRFEWTRQAFQTWAQNVAKCFGYRVTFFPVGPIDEEVGSPAQMAIFQLEAEMVR